MLPVRTNSMEVCLDLIFTIKTTVILLESNKRFLVYSFGLSLLYTPFQLLLLF